MNGAPVLFSIFLSNIFGEWGLFALKAFILSAIFILIIKIIKLQNNKNTAGILYFIFLGFSLLPGITNLIRCQMFTYLFFTLWLYLLEKIKREKDKLIWIFPVTMLLWANMHGGFLAGIGLVLIYAFGELLNRKNYLKYFGILALIIPVTLINPYGFELWNYIINASLMPRPDIPEWHSISLNGPFHMIAGIKIHIHSLFYYFRFFDDYCLCKNSYRKRKNGLDIVFTCSLYYYYLSVKHQRHTMFFVLAVPGLFYHHYLNLLDPIQRFVKNILTDKLSKIWNTVRYGFGYVLLSIIFVLYIPQLSNRINVNPSIYPVGSLEFIKQNKISGNLATSYTLGQLRFMEIISSVQNSYRWKI